MVGGTLAVCPRSLGEAGHHPTRSALTVLWAAFILVLAQLTPEHARYLHFDLPTQKQLARRLRRSPIPLPYVLAFQLKDMSKAACGGVPSRNSVKVVDRPFLTLMHG